jgi:hypothetical protein
MSVEDQVHLVFATVDMQWRPLLWRDDVLDRGERIARRLRAGDDPSWTANRPPKPLTLTGQYDKRFGWSHAGVHTTPRSGLPDGRDSRSQKLAGVPVGQRVALEFGHKPLRLPAIDWCRAGRPFIMRP